MVAVFCSQRLQRCVLSQPFSGVEVSMCL